MHNQLINIPKHFSSAQPELERRIDDEIIVDAYNNDEVTTAWYYHLEEALNFPFTAMVLTHRSGNASHLHQVKLIGMAPIDRCGYWQMWVVGKLALLSELPLHFFLSDVSQIEPNQERMEALTAWLYWMRNQSNEIITLK